MTENMNNPAIERLKELVEKSGGVVKAAEALEVSPALLSLVLAGKRRVSAKLACKLGVERQIVYAEVPVIGVLTSKGDCVGDALKNWDAQQ